MPNRTTPEDGDIVVRDQLRGHTLTYVLYVAPGGAECEFQRREDGIAHALGLAYRDHVRAWLTDDGYVFVLLEDLRVVKHVRTREALRRQSEDSRQNRNDD